VVRDALSVIACAQATGLQEQMVNPSGRFATATDPAPTTMLETTIMLKPEYVEDASEALEKVSEFTPSFSFSKSSPRISLYPKAAMLAAFQRLRHDPMR